jgi:hypothetical protein
MPHVVSRAAADLPKLEQKPEWPIAKLDLETAHSKWKLCLALLETPQSPLAGSI